MKLPVGARENPAASHREERVTAEEHRPISAVVEVSDMSLGVAGSVEYIQLGLQGFQHNPTAARQTVSDLGNGFADGTVNGNASEMRPQAADPTHVVGVLMGNENCCQRDAARFHTFDYRLSRTRIYDDSLRLARAMKEPNKIVSESVDWSDVVHGLLIASAGRPIWCGLARRRDAKPALL